MITLNLFFFVVIPVANFYYLELLHYMYPVTRSNICVQFGPTSTRKILTNGESDGPPK